MLFLGLVSQSYPSSLGLAHRHQEQCEDQILMARVALEAVPMRQPDAYRLTAPLELLPLTSGFDPNPMLHVNPGRNPLRYRMALPQAAHAQIRMR